MVGDLSSNPKNMAAKHRVKMALLPSVGVIHGAAACMDGARKYGAFNWRDEKIALMEYASAAQRHLADWIDGEDVAPDSGVHHLGHAIATCAIMLDAVELNEAIDDRPKKGAAPAVLERLKNRVDAVAVADVAAQSMRVQGYGDLLDAGMVRQMTPDGPAWVMLGSDDSIPPVYAGMPWQREYDAATLRGLGKPAPTYTSSYRCKSGNVRILGWARHVRDHPKAYIGLEIRDAREVLEHFGEPISP